MRLAQILDVHVSAEPGVVGQIPAGVVGVFVNDDWIRVPEPVADVVDVAGEDAEVPAVEPEAVRPAAAQMIHMASSETPGKASVLPRVLDAKARVIATGVPDPAVISGIHVRSIGMAWCVTEIALLWGSALLAASGSGSFLATAAAHRRFRAARWNVSAADLGVSATVRFPVLRQTYCKTTNRHSREDRGREQEGFSDHSAPVVRLPLAGTVAAAMVVQAARGTAPRLETDRSPGAWGRP